MNPWSSLGSLLDLMINLDSKTKVKSNHGRHLNLTFGLSRHVNAHVGTQMFTCSPHVCICMCLYTCTYMHVHRCSHTPICVYVSHTHMKKNGIYLPFCLTYLIPLCLLPGSPPWTTALIGMSVFKETQAKTLAEYAGFKFTSSCFPLLSVAYSLGDTLALLYYP